MKNFGSKIKNNLTYIACLLMILGIHLPLYIYSKGNHIGLEYRTNQEGLLLLLSVALVIIEKNNNRIKHLLGPIIFQIGIVIYYIIYMVSDKKFVTPSWGIVCDVLSILVLGISMIINVYDDSEYTHDISTMKIVKTEEYEYCEKFILKDSIWIVGVIVITTCLVLFKVNSDNHNLNSQDNISSKSVSASDKENIKTSLEFDYDCENYSIGINDAYITNENGEEIVFLEINIKNKTHISLVFNELFELVVKQGNTELERCAKVASDVFDSNSGLAQISLLETSKVYIPYVLVESQKDLKVSLISLEDEEKTVINDKIVKLNDVYYADNLEEIISIGERKISLEDNKDIKNDDKDDVETIENKKTNDEENKEQVATANPLEKATSEPNEIDEEEKTTVEPEKTPDVEDEIPTEQASEEEKVLSGTVKFVKPSTWDENSKVYIYLYDSEEVSVEKTRIEMSECNNGICTFFLNKIDMSKEIYIVFGNDTKIYPENNKKLVLSMGKKYTSN